MCDHSMRPLYVRPLYETTRCDHSMWDHSMWPLYVWPLCVRTEPQSCKTPKSTSSRAGCRHHHKNTKNTTTTPQSCKTPKSTSSRAGCWHHKSTNTKTPPHHQNRLQFMGRMLQTTEKYENYYEKSTSVLGPDVAEHRKARELARKIDFSSWAECCSAKNVKKARVLL